MAWADFGRSDELFGLGLFMTALDVLHERAVCVSAISSTLAIYAG